MKKTISIFLALIMVLSTMSLSVFALDELPAADGQPTVDQTDVLGDGETPAANNETTVTEENQDMRGANDPQLAEGEGSGQEDATQTEGEGEGQSEGEETDPWKDVEATAKSDTTNEAVVTWTKDVDGAQAYKVEAIKGEETEPAKTVEVTADAEDKATVTDLEAGKYTFKLHAYKDAECTETEEILPPLVTNAVTVKDPDPEPEPEKLPPAPKNVKTYSAYKSIAIEWDPVKNAKGYRVYRNGKRIYTVTPEMTAYDNKKKMAYIDNDHGKGLDDGPKKIKKYKYTVTACVGSQESKPSKEVVDFCVRQMYIKATFKQTVTLTSHDGKNKKHTFKSGETVYMTGYTMGKYHFTYEIGGKNYLFHVMYGRLSNLKAMYTKKYNFSKKEAEYFANTVGKYGQSKTKYMIWVNLHTQHIYILKGKQGKWRINKSLKYNDKVFNNWEISSGTANTPTPWGLGLKFGGNLVNIYKRHPAPPGHGARLWNYFHSETAIHGPVTSSFGIPHSHGCIRNPMENAQFNYNKLPLHTRTLIF
jgi:hypothetical protein